MLTLILFDFDGTLVPSLEYWVAAYQRSLEHFGHVVDFEGIQQTCFYRPYSEITAHYKIDALETFDAKMLYHLQDLFLHAQLFEEARDSLELCRAKGLRIGMVTSTGKRLLYPVLEALQLSEMFSCIVTGDDVAECKPSAEPIERALWHFGIPPQKALMVGDYSVDVLAGKLAGTKTALFLPERHGDFYDLAWLRGHEPDHIFEHHREFPALLESLGAR